MCKVLACRTVTIPTVKNDRVICCYYWSSPNPRLLVPWTCHARQLKPQSNFYTFPRFMKCTAAKVNSREQSTVDICPPHPTLSTNWDANWYSRCFVCQHSSRPHHIMSSPKPLSHRDLLCPTFTGSYNRHLRPHRLGGLLRWQEVPCLPERR